jgi:carbamoyl-phosphate synthase large subunit
MNILISSAGRRVALIGCFRQSLKHLSLSSHVMAIDAATQSAAGQIADQFMLVPRCTDPGFMDAVLEICKGEHIDLLVPTIDTELKVYAAARKRFESSGVRVVISDPLTIAICEDKFETHAWLAVNGFPTPRQSTPQCVLDNSRDWTFPLIAKPRAGSASVGVVRIRSISELLSLSDREDLVIEEIALGCEYTINVYVNLDGQCISAVPHRRLEVRAGEVSKGITVKNRALMRLGCEIAEKLPGARGPLNIQCFLADSGDIRVIEINPRFGGGYPLAHEAGAHFTSWIIWETLGQSVTGDPGCWEDGLLMLRYDDAVFLKCAEMKAG